MYLPVLGVYIHKYFFHTCQQNTWYKYQIYYYNKNNAYDSFVCVHVEMLCPNI